MLVFLCFCLPEAPLIHASPIVGAVLQSVHLLSLSGHSAPSYSKLPSEDNWEWICDLEGSESPKMYSSQEEGLYRRYQRIMSRRFMKFPPNCNPGELTIIGMRQMSELGAFYRDYLVNESGFLTNYLDEELISIKTSRHDRSIRSAECFINELYPPAVPDQEELVITSGNAYYDPLDPSISNNDEIESRWISYTTSNQFINMINYTQQLVTEMLPQYDNNLMFWDQLGDWLYSNYVNNGKFPANVTEELAIELMKSYYSVPYHFSSYSNGIASKGLFDIIMSDIDDAISRVSKKGKFKLYILERFGFISFLQIIGSLPHFIPYRSHLSIELWKMPNSTSVIRFVLNGNVISPINGTNAIHYGQFKEHIWSKKLDNHIDH